MTLIDQFQVVLVFLLIGVAMIVAPMIGLAILRPHKPSAVKAMPYECGKEAVGGAQVCFDMRFYTDALVFLIFEVETVFLFPWARVFKQEGWTGIALYEGLIFVAVLFLGLIYVWAKGDLDWVKSTVGTKGTHREEGVEPFYPDPHLTDPRQSGARKDFPAREPVGATAGGDS